MAFPFAGLGTLIGGLGSAAGGLAGLFGGGGRGGFDQAAFTIAQQNLAFQDAAAKNGIRWKVADAKAAGVHPLFALGAPTFNPSPVSYSGQGVAGDGTPGYLAEMGQGIGRAISATQTQEEKQKSATEILLQQQAVERGGLQNDLLRAQIASLNARTAGAQVGPSFPAITTERGGLPGQGNVEVQPAKPVSQSVGAPSSQAGPGTPEVQWVRSPTGVFARPTDPNMDQSIINPEYIRFLIKNRLLGHIKPSDDVLRREFPGASSWSFYGGEWQPRGGRYPKYRVQY